MKSLKYIFLSIIISLFFLSSTARELDKIIQSGKLYVGFDETDIGTINYTLAYEFAEFMNLELVEVVVEWDKLFQNDGIRPKDLETNPDISYTPDAFNEVDIYCSTISPLHWRKKLFDFAETLLSAEMLVVQKDFKKRPKDIYQMKGMSIGLMQGTSFVTHLELIDAKIGGGIEMVKTADGNSSKQLLIDHQVDGIILDAEDALRFNKENNQNFFLAFPINKVEKTVWAVEKGNDLSLQVKNFFKAIENNGYLDKLYELNYSATYSSFSENLVPHTPIQIYHRDLDEILASKKLVVALRQRDFVFHKNGDKQFMHILAEEFAEYLGVKMEYVVVSEFGTYWQDQNGVITKDSSYTPEIFNYFDIASDIFAKLPWRERKINMIPIYESTYDVIAKPKTNINSTSDLNNFIGVTATNTLYEELLEEQGAKNLVYASPNNLIKEVRNNKADYTLIFNAFLYPDLESKVSLGKLDVNWATRKDQPKLKKAIEQFIIESSNNGLLNTLSKIARGASFNTIEDFLKNYYESSQPGTLPHILVGVDEGLPQEDVRTIFQDSKGYLWFGTLSGIVRYNGRKMEQINTSNGLVHNSTNYITEDHNGDLLVATEKGISCIKNNGEIKNYPSSFSFHQIYIDHKNTKWLISEKGLFTLENDQIIQAENIINTTTTGSINGMCQDTATTFYFIAAKKGLFLIDEDKKLTKKVFNSEIYSVFIDKKNTIWFSSPRGLFYQSIKDLQEDRAPKLLNKQLQMPKTPINGITQSNNGSIWLKNSTHLYQVISPQQAAIQYSSGDDLLNNFILSYTEDSEENLWIGYSGGLQRIINNKNIRNLFPDELNSYIASVLLDPLGNVWVSSNKWIYRYHAETEKLQNFSHTLGLKLGHGILKLLPNNNILLIHKDGIFEINPKTLKIVFNKKMRLQGLSDAFISSKGELFILGSRMGLVYHFVNYKKDYTLIQDENTSNILGLVEFENTVLGIKGNTIVKFNGKQFVEKQKFTASISAIGNIDNTIWLGSSKGLMLLQKDTIKTISLGNNIIIKSIIPSKNRNHLWVGTNLGVYYFNIEQLQIVFKMNAKEGLSGNEVIQNGLYLDHNGLLWISTYHGLSNFNIKGTLDARSSPRCYLEDVKVNDSSFDFLVQNEFQYNQNNFAFELSGLFYSDEKSIIYEHYLRNNISSQNYFRSNKEHTIYYNNLSPGDYEFVYRAKGKDGIWSYTSGYSFSIEKPIWQTWSFRIISIILFALFLYTIYKVNVRRIIQQKKQLEKVVKERTIDLEDANKKVVAQMNIAEEQRDKITVQNQQITNSIYYAERIQKSLLPSGHTFEKHLNDYFVLFKPRDIVSGDFYWMMQFDRSLLIAAVDCTGHGVPGAFMSMLGISFLKEIVERERTSDPAIIMNKLRNAVITALQQDQKNAESKDGMDMSLVSINLDSLQLQFAGANNPIYIIREKMGASPDLIHKRIKTNDHKLFEIKGDKMPIAIYERMRDFESMTIQLKKGDRVYLFSDGYIDQFGGEKGKKFKSPAFKRMLLEHQNIPMTKSKILLEETFEDWRGDEDQIDDVTLIGIEI
ncbi:MAG: transporter substrate-binding domain-containing protein [Bacteroidales bacterium]|nr:transporter substrate-binding domain-containing protein [Bacteroidales bacterium]